MITIHLLRHGALAGDYHDRFVGQIDPPLAPEGMRQAAALASALSARGIGAVFCSDLARARQTAAIIAGAARVPITTCGELRELAMGEWEGLSRHEVAVRFPDEYAARGRDIADYRVPGGESFEDCRRRALLAWETIVHCGHQHIVAVGHAGINRLLLCHLLGMPVANLFRLGQDYGCVNVIEQSGEHACVRLLNARPADLGT